MDKPLIVSFLYNTRLQGIMELFLSKQISSPSNECNYSANVTHTANRPLSFGGNPSPFLKFLDHYLRFTSGKKECHLVHFGDHLGSRESDRVGVEGSFSHMYTEFHLP